MIDSSENRWFKYKQIIHWETKSDAQADIHNYTWMLVNRSSSRDNDLGGIKSNHKWDTSQKDKLKT